MKVSDVMSTQAQVVRDTDSVRTAMHVMLDGGFSGVPVVDASHRLVGILTEGDVIRRAESGTVKPHTFWNELLRGPDRLAREYAATHGRVVREIMTPDVWTVDATAPLETAVTLMEKHRVKRLPVIEAGKLVGMISRSDLVKAVLRVMDAAASQPKAIVSDALIKANVARELANQPWTPSETVHVQVAHGEVELCGVITNESVRDALCVLVENVPGVVRVKDRLTTIEPMSGCIVHAPDPS